MTALDPPRVEHGDNLEVGARWRAEGVLCRMIYVDPPFGTGVVHGARTRRGEARADRSTRAYDDAFEGIDAFLAALRPRLELFRALLDPTGTMYLHLDHRAVHDAKVLCDQVFGRGAFRGEIVWAPGNGARSRLAWGATHQTILCYTRDDRPAGKARYVFHADRLREPFAEGSAAQHFRHVDADGRRYRVRRVAGKDYRYYLDDGRRLGTVWTDVPAMAANTPLSKETTGYPHQKPERLLERLILASTDEGDAVADLFCGSGTTLAVAARLGRRALGCDASPLAVSTTRRRLGLSDGAGDPAPP